MKRCAALLGMIAISAGAWGAVGQEPYIGYVYPAGGQQGTVFEVTAAGQRLRGARDVYISGEGVRASVVGYEPPGGPLNRLQQEELRRRILEIREKRTGIPAKGKRAANKPKNGSAKPAGNTPDGTPPPKVTLPDLPELRNLDQLTTKQLRAIVDKFLSPGKRPKPPIAERVTLKITVDPDAAPGDRELRIRTMTGLTNPVVFQVGQIPEVREPDGTEKDEGPLPPAHLPVVLNGQIMPGEVDRFPLELRGGEKVVVDVQARELIPYLADAVPGWFQAVVALYDENGKELAYDDDCGFDPDPALVFKPPHDGTYTLQIRDAIYRGREDFVYRVDVGAESLIRSLFPLGSRGGVSIGPGQISRAAFSKSAKAYFLSEDKSLPERDEVEPNNTEQKPMSITLPQVITGSISVPGDKDVFAFEGRAGEQIVADVYARRMGSPLDSLLRLMDAKGRVIAWNDDHPDKETGLLTHHADSYLSARLPSAGRYFVQLSDAESHGGPGFIYGLRIGPPQPDFALRLTPSSLNIRGGSGVTATLYAIRKDGWDGDIDVVLKDAPTGFELSGARIPKGKDQVKMTLTAPRRRFNQPVALHLEGRAEIGGKTVTRPVVPAEDKMQAFAYYHLVPSQELMATVIGGGQASRKAVRGSLRK